MGFGFGIIGCLKVFYMVTAFFFTALMQNGFMLMMCKGNPSGKTTVVDYPHIECLGPVWLDYLFPMVLYLLVVGIVFLIFGCFIVKKQAIHLGQTCVTSRGTWQIISQDFRTQHIYWPIILQLKDIL